MAGIPTVGKKLSDRVFAVSDCPTVPLALEELS